MQEYKLIEVSKPNLYREIFPYREVPRIVFDYKIVPMNLPSEIWITDTTFRDGQQARPPYTEKQVVDLFTLMHKLGGPQGIIRQSEFFLYSDRDRKCVEACLAKNFKYPEVTGWIRAHPKDFQIVKSMGLKETGILTSASDYHIFLKLGKGRKEAMHDYLNVVKAALEERIIPRCHLEDITRADFYGFVIPFVQALMKLSHESRIPIKVRACDTMGYGVPFPGAALPRAVDKIIYELIHVGGVPSERLEWHGHNDFHKVNVNGTVAWLYGCAAVNATLLGFGERTGNPPIEAAIMDYISITGKAATVKTEVITEIAKYYEEEIGYKIPTNTPFIGKNFNVTMAGIHADGVLKNEEIYNIFDTKKILKRPLGVVINDKSGTAGITYWLNSHLGLKGKAKISKNDERVIDINKWVLELYKNGRITGISDEEMLEQTRKFFPEHFTSEFAKLKKRAEELARHLVEAAVETKEIKSLNPKVQEAYLRKMSKESSFIQFIYVVDKNGKKITKNITQPQDRKAYEIFDLLEDFSSRIWFKEPLKTKKSYISDFYTSKITGKLCITVAAPIEKRKKVSGVLGVDIKFEDLASL